ncbi:uncharacterized protein LOC120328812 [Styela clava]
MMSTRNFGVVLLAILLFELILLHHVRCHSWVVCTDYIEKNGLFYNPNKCRGYPRAANRFLPKNKEFGSETGYSHQPTEDQACRVRRNDHAHYDLEYPMAVYYPGQQVVLAHPMKEHGADADCTNPYIPDTGNWIYRSDRNARADPTLSQFMQNLVFDLSASPLNDEILSKSYPKPGFQNAPAFCLNQDKSLGTYSFNVPLNLSPGRYTFMWLWAFNNMGDLFTTCYEVQIVRDQIERDRKLLNNGFKNFTEPCGGMTSNPEIRGVCNMAVGHNTAGTNNEIDGGGGAEAVQLHWILLYASIFVHLFCLCN